MTAGGPPKPSDPGWPIAHRQVWQRPRLWCWAAMLLVAAAAHAHHLTPDEVAARLSAADVRQSFDVIDVARPRDLPRLLVVRVGRGWASVDPLRRVSAAEEWYQLWRDAEPDGVVAIVDTEDRPLVNFDASGGARVRDSAAARATPR